MLVIEKEILFAKGQKRFILEAEELENEEGNVKEEKENERGREWEREREREREWERERVRWERKEERKKEIKTWEDYNHPRWV